MEVRRVCRKLNVMLTCYTSHPGSSEEPVDSQRNASMSEDGKDKIEGGSKERKEPVARAAACSDKICNVLRSCCLVQCDWLYRCHEHCPRSQVVLTGQHSALGTCVKGKSASFPTPDFLPLYYDYDGYNGGTFRFAYAGRAKF